eukprot:Awhi_evm1s4556
MSLPCRRFLNLPLKSITTTATSKTTVTTRTGVPEIVQNSQLITAASGRLLSTLASTSYTTTTGKTTSTTASTQNSQLITAASGRLLSTLASTSYTTTTGKTTSTTASTQVWKNQSFTISQPDSSSFIGTGLRPFFEYRDLGIEGGTKGKYGAHVIRAVPGVESEPKWHVHELEFQMVYVLK